MMSYMRTTVTLDDDVAYQLQNLSARLRKPFKVILNDVIRNGLPSMEKPQKIKPFKVKTWNLKLRPGYEGVNFNHLATELEDEAIIEKLHQGR
jgi:predicted transcriptional regulator